MILTVLAVIFGLSLLALVLAIWLWMPDFGNCPKCAKRTQIGPNGYFQCRVCGHVWYPGQTDLTEGQEPE